MEEKVIQLTSAEAEERVKSLLENDEALEKMVLAESPEALMEVLKENKITFEGVTPKEVFAAFQSAKKGELNEKDLENVSGGMSFSIALGTLSIAASGVTVTGALVFIGGAALIGLATYAGYKYIKKKIK